MKRTRAVTGKDRWYNTIHSDNIESAADTYTTKEIRTPQNRIQSGKMAFVMELLHIDMEIDPSLNASGETVEVEFYTGPAGTAMLGFSSPRVFARVKKEMNVVTSGGNTELAFLRYDLQTKDGFGYLLATDKFNVAIKGTNTGVTNSISFKLHYRFINVPQNEYFGILQSQQGSS